jgi:hypothetical protein
MSQSPKLGDEDSQSPTKIKVPSKLDAKFLSHAETNGRYGSDQKMVMLKNQVVSRFKGEHAKSLANLAMTDDKRSTFQVQAANKRVLESAKTAHKNGNETDREFRLSIED